MGSSSLFDRIHRMRSKVQVALSLLALSAVQWLIGKLLDWLQPKLSDYWSPVVTGLQEALGYLPASSLLLLAIGAGMAVLWDYWSGKQNDEADDAWRARDRLEIHEIACRAAGISPPSLTVPSGPALSVMRNLCDAIRDRDLSAIGDVDGDPLKGGGTMAQITHGALAGYALKSGNDTLFKFANDWKPLKDAGFKKLLYLGDITLDAQSLDRDKLSITIRCFNGSTSQASVAEVGGSVEYRPREGAARNIGTPLLTASGAHQVSVGWGEELFFTLDLAVPSDLARDMINQFANGEVVTIGFQDLTVACELGPPIRSIVQMPLWNGVQYVQIDGRACPIGWIIGISAKITV